MKTYWPPATRGRSLVLGVALLVAGACTGLALAWSGETGSGYTKISFTNPDQADITTCASQPSHVWARGPATNTYKVFPRRPDGTYLVYENFQARYKTLAGQSVGACNNGTPDNGNTIGQGVKVRLTASAVYAIHNGTFDPNATCVTVNPSCLITRFTTSFFGPAASFQNVSEVGIYESRCNGSWLGSGPNASGQQAGDITGAKNDCDD